MECFCERVRMWVERARNEWIVDECLVHWKGNKTTIICFRNQLPSEFNVMWRHWILYQSKGILQRTCAPAQPSNTNTIAVRSLSSVCSCYVEYVIWNFLSFATVCITPYHCCGIENTTQLLFVVNTHSHTLANWLKGKFVVCTKRFSSLLFECVFPLHAHTQKHRVVCLHIMIVVRIYT